MEKVEAANKDLYIKICFCSSVIKNFEVKRSSIDGLKWMSC